MNGTKAKFCNGDLKSEMLENDISYQEVADEMKVKVSVLISTMNMNLSVDTRKKIIYAINSLKVLNEEVKSAEITNGRVCRFVPHGVLCTHEGEKCNKCGWNPIVAHKRLADMERRRKQHA